MHPKPRNIWVLALMETQRHPYTTRTWCSESHAHALLCSLQMRSCQVITSTYVNKYFVFSPQHIRLPIKILFLQGINKQLEFGNPALVLSPSAPRGPPHIHTLAHYLSRTQDTCTHRCVRALHMHTRGCTHGLLVIHQTQGGVVGTSGL